MTIAEQVRQFICKNFYVPDPAGLSDTASFLDLGIVDSTGVLEVVAFIEQQFGITVDESDNPDYNPLDPDSQAKVEDWRREIQRIMQTRTVADWMREFEAAEATVSPLQFPEEMADDPQTQALGMMVELEHELTGYQRMVGPIMEMSATPPSVRGAAPLVGSHTDEVLAEFGYTPEEIEQLVQEGVAATYTTADNLDLQGGGVKVLTLKNAKGLEFPVVALAGFADPRFPMIPAGSAEEEREELSAEERRALFVEMTRAMRALLVVVPPASALTRPEARALLSRGFAASRWNVGEGAAS